MCPEKDKFVCLGLGLGLTWLGLAWLDLVGIRIRVNNRVGEGNGQSSIRSK